MSRHILPFFMIVVITSLSAHVGATCNRVCKGSNHEFPIRYPFGFSDGCKIRLHCVENQKIRIGSYSVLNFTRDHILIDMPAKCDRAVSEIRLLRTDNYALTWRNGLLLGNCSDTLNDCVMPRIMIEHYLNLSRCELKTSKLRCYLDDSRDPMEFMELTRLEMAGCSYLYSSITTDLDRNSTHTSAVSIGFQSMELGWWVQGDCNCHHNADCKNVSIDNERVGYRCHCMNGYDGDGFLAGEGCRRVSNCNASKYLSGECGGTTRLALLIGGTIAGVSLFSGVALLCYCVRRQVSLRKQNSAINLLSGNFSVPFYTYKELERATNGFSEKQRLGIGAYGMVYAGKLSNNEWVAIKKIRHIDTYGIQLVMNEIKLLSSVSHPNLVRLLGCCIEKDEQILVYEFMPNGTLSQHLQRERGEGLPWKKRLTIATETAHAIAYLHSTVNPPIYHRDIKSSNILLDYNYGSKVADFGLSRLGMLDESHISTAPQGTPGYVDPQYHQNFHLSDKSDVYSFGVVLVEIITALKVVDLSRNNSEVNLAALAVDKIGKGCVDEIIDPFLDPNRDAWTLSSIHKVAELAFRCLAFHGDMRPSMTEVAEELEEIRLSQWAQTDHNITTASFSVASASSSSPHSEKSKAGGLGSRKLMVSHMLSNYLSKSEEKDNSPVSVVQDPWSSEGSPSTNSLLGNMVQ